VKKIIFFGFLVGIALMQGCDYAEDMITKRINESRVKLKTKTVSFGYFDDGFVMDSLINFNQKIIKHV
jgi:hypothetical protein